MSRLLSLLAGSTNGGLFGTLDLFLSVFQFLSLLARLFLDLVSQAVSHQSVVRFICD